MTEPEGLSDLELLAMELAEQALAVLPADAPADLVSLIRVVIETDLLFDPSYADLMKAELFDRKHRDASGTVRSTPRSPGKAGPEAAAEGAARELARRLHGKVGK